MNTYSIVLLDDKDNPLKKCDCNLRTFTYLDLTTGYRIHKCRLPGYLLDDRLPNFVEASRKPCNFYECEVDFVPEFPKCPPPKPKFVPPKKLSNYEILEDLCQGFLLTKSYHTFQEIEILCKRIGQPTYSNSNSGLYEFVVDLLDLSRRRSLSNKRKAASST
jgi:hypothetical protein